jgi:hypothetical protein
MSFLRILRDVLLSKKKLISLHPTFCHQISPYVLQAGIGLLDHRPSTWMVDTLRRESKYASFMCATVSVRYPKMALYTRLWPKIYYSHGPGQAAPIVFISLKGEFLHDLLLESTNLMLHKFHHSGIPQVYNNCWMDPIANLYALDKRKKNDFPSCASKLDFLVFHSIALPLSLTVYQTISIPKLKLLFVSQTENTGSLRRLSPHSKTS